MTTKHTHQVVFGRRVDGCPRCAELAAGAPAIRWNVSTAKANEAAFVAALRAHDCRKAGCAHVCTFGEW